MTQKGYIHSEEQYLEMYTRLGLEPEDFETADVYRAKLWDELGYEPTDAQAGTMARFSELGIEKWQAAGIHGVRFPKTFFGPSVRYYVPGLRGAFGYKGVVELLTGKRPWVFWRR